MLGITPFQYNPITKELIVYRDVEVEVSFEGGNNHFGEDRLRSRNWDPILKDAILNSSTYQKLITTIAQIIHAIRVTIMLLLFLMMQDLLPGLIH